MTDTSPPLTTADLRRIVARACELLEERAYRMGKNWEKLGPQDVLAALEQALKAEEK